MTPPSSDLRLGEWRFDRHRRCLTRGTESAELSAKEAGVLLHLAEASPEFVSTEALLARTWSDVVVTDNVVHQNIARLRRVFGDDPRRPVVIETRRRLGYRLALPVVQLGTPLNPARRIVIKPMVHGCDESRRLAAGLEESIASALAPYPDLCVAMHGDPDEPPGATSSRDHASFPGGDYELGGSVRLIGSTVRTVFHLLDNASRSLVWSRSFDHASRGEQWFDLEDHMLGIVGAAVADTFGAVRVRDMERLAAERKPSTSSFEAVLLAQNVLREGWPRDRVDAAIHALELATAREPGYAEAWSWLAAMYRDQLSATYPNRRHPDASVPLRAELEENWRRAEAAAQRAIDIDRGNQEALIVLLGARQARQDYRGMRQLADRALALNPTSADLHLAVACYLAISAIDDAAQHAHQALLLAQPEPLAVMYLPLFLHHYRIGEYPEALEFAEYGLGLARDSWLEWALLLGALAAAGQLHDAESAGRTIARLKARERWGADHTGAFFEMSTYHPDLVRHLRAGLDLVGANR